MLYIAKSLKDLDFRALMDIYIEGNAEKGDILQAEQDFYQYLREVFFTVSGAFYALWQDRGMPVSALRMEPYKDGLLLEALETRPDARRQGYAAQLVKAALEYVGQGKVYAHVHKKNVASLKTHEKCGFVRISEIARYIDGSVNDRCCTLLADMDKR